MARVEFDQVQLVRDGASLVPVLHVVTNVQMGWSNDEFYITIPELLKVYLTEDEADRLMAHVSRALGSTPPTPSSA